ncbi:MAG: ABC transporter permease [Rhodothermales bacterium]
MDLSIQETTRHKPFPTIHWVWQYRELLRNLIVRDLKLQYRGAFLGVVWSLLSPVLLVLVYIVAFNVVLRFRLAHYPLWLLTGLLHWQFFAGATIASSNTLINNAPLIHNIHFPRFILPLAVVGARGIHLLLAMAAYFLLFIPMGGHLWSGMLLYPIVLLLQVLFVIGMTLCVSILTLHFRDLKHLLEVGIPMLFWLTPIIYNFSQIPEWAHLWFRLNPMVSYVISYQDILYLNQVPSIGNWGFMVLFAFGSLGLGSYLFWRWRSNMEDYL